VRHLRDWEAWLKLGKAEKKKVKEEEPTTE